MYSFSKLMTQHALTLIGLFFALTSGQPAKAGPCEVNSVAEGAYLFDSAKEMVVTPNNQWLLALDEVAGDLKVIQIATQQVITTFNLQGLEPGGLSLSPDGTTLYVSGAFNGNLVVADISAPDPTQWAITATWHLPGDFGAMQVDSKNTSQLLVTDRRIKGVRVLSTIDGSEQATLSTEHCGLPVDLLQHGSLLFVACEISNKVAVFDLESNEHRKSINVGKAPVALLLHPTRPNLYVANRQSGSISVINTDNLELLKLNLSNANVLSHPRDLLWLNGTIWILDQSAAALVALDIREEQFKPGICIISSQPAFLTAVTLPGQQMIYAAHSDGVDLMSINIPFTRRQPQVLMAGFDPILLDIKDTRFSVLVVVEEGLAPLDTVSIEQNLGGLKRVMNLVGSIPLVVEEGRQIDGLVYEAVFEIERGAFPPGTVATEVMGLPTLSLFGDLPQQFHLRARDVAEQTHAYPRYQYGNWPLIENQQIGTAVTVDNYTKQGPRRALPQVIMAGFAPMLMDIGDTELTVLAIVRKSVAEIRHVTFSPISDSPFSVTMNKLRDLPNGDEMFQGTVATQRGQRLFPEGYEFSSVWNDMFQIVVTDKAQQTHQFPNFRVGNYPEID
jgi:hypothetical protein